MKNNESVSGYNFFSSWSGGKDSCLSLYRMIQKGNYCSSLFTMLDETGLHSRSHGLTHETLLVQAQAMGIPLVISKAAWGEYEAQFKMLTTQFKRNNVEHGVFGDIDLEPHREWIERVCNETGIAPHLPLWKENRRKIVEEFIDLGFKALIVVVNCNLMPERFLGRIMDMELIEELEAEGVDACGENGEFHTFVYDGPLFKKKITLSKGTEIHFDWYTFLPVHASLIEERSN
ncbi:MAG: diphthine--ammonia ligase [Chitinispirillaceae bacterium]|nr:diphthine--ammonia ligase [Chitinispirillaceae bacterium]